MRKGRLKYQISVWSNSFPPMRVSSNHYHNDHFCFLSGSKRSLDQREGCGSHGLKPRPSFGNTWQHDFMILQDGAWGLGGHRSG
jgi:hypothetical protein